MSTLDTHRKIPSPEALARRRARYLTGLLWHAGAFLIINAFFWLLDFGLNYGQPHWAYWITFVWAVALAFHALAYLIDGRQLENRKTEQYLAQKRDR
jgi:2TM domain